MLQIKTITNLFNRILSTLILVGVGILLVSCVTPSKGRVDELINQLESKDAAVRKKATLKLFLFGTKEASAVEPLIRLLNDENDTVRYYATFALGYIGPPAVSAVPALTKIMEGNNRDLHRGAAIALGKIGPQAAPAVNALAKALETGDLTVRIAAAEALEKIGPKAAPAIGPLIKALNDESIMVRLNAAEALGNFRPQAAIAAEALAKSLGDIHKFDSSGYSPVAVHDKVYAALEKLGSLAIPGWVVALDNPNEDIQILAIENLSQFGSKATEAIPSLIKSTLDPKVKVRQAAGLALEKISTNNTELELTTIKVLTEALKDDNSIVRKLAVEGLGKLGTKAVSSLRQITRALNDPNADVRKKAAWALGELGTEDSLVIMALLEALDDESIGVSTSAAKSLEKINPQKTTTFAEYEKYFTEDKKANLSYALAKAESEKKALTTRLYSEIDLKRRLEESLTEQEVAYKKQQEMLTNFYERERQLKSKLFQFGQAQREAEETGKKLVRLQSKADKLNKELARSKSNEVAKFEKEEELKRVIKAKLSLEKEALALKEKKSELNAEVFELGATAKKARLEAEQAKEALSAKQKREVELTRQVEELKKRLDHLMAPVVIVSKPKNGSKTKSSTAMLHIIVIDDRGVRDVNATLNGAPITLKNNRGLKVTAVKKFENFKRVDLVKRLKLKYGQNKIKISATNTEGIVTEELIRILREKERGDIWAVVIGINQ